MIEKKGTSLGAHSQPPEECYSCRTGSSDKLGLTINETQRLCMADHPQNRVGFHQPLAIAARSGKLCNNGLLPHATTRVRHAPRYLPRNRNGLKAVDAAAWDHGIRRRTTDMNG